MLNLNNLRVFYMVAKYQSVLQAANALFISQPAVSNTLKKIQQEFNISLFKKEGRTLTLTEQGEKLFALSAQIFVAEETIEDFLSTLRQKSVETINLGVATLYERFAMVDIMSYFEGSNLMVSVISGNSRTLLSLLDENKIDMAIAGKMTLEDEKKYCYVPYKNHNVYLIIPKTHKMYGKKTFTPEDINEEKMILKEQGSSVRNAIENYCIKHNINFSGIAELSNLDSLLSVSISENCLTFIPDMAVHDLQKHHDNFSIATAKDDSISFQIYLITKHKEHYTQNVWNNIMDFFASAACTLP